MYQFFAPDIATTYCLPEEESQHCVQVLRAQIGDKIQITDGRGTLYTAEITNPHRHHCEVRIVSEEHPEPLHEGHIHIAIAPTKNIDRIEWMIEKCTEIGVDEITPLLCRFSERKNINHDRLQRIMIAAAKQSLKVTYPVINELTPFNDFIAQNHHADKFIAHCADGYDANPNKFALQNCLTPGHAMVILIGPEGDFSEQEIADALKAGYKPVSLGKARLRTETAGLVAGMVAVLAGEKRDLHRGNSGSNPSQQR